MAIANAHAQCQAAFETLLESSNADLIASGVNLEDVNELFGKYKLWAGNVGAIHYGKRYEISLDYRLREATLVKDQVLQVLATLLEKVTSATSLVQGLRAPFEKRRLELEEDRTSLNSSSETTSINRGAPNEEEDESDSPWDISSNSSGTSEHLSQKQQISKLANVVENSASAYALSNTANVSRSSPYRLGMVLEKEMPQLMKSITLAITALYRMPIRKAAPFDRLKNKELLDFSCYQHFDVMYVKDKFPALDVGVATRLGKSITKRRQIIYYRSTHAMNIDASNEKAPTILSPRPASKMSGMMADSELQPVAPPSVGASSKFTLRSKATTFKAGQSLLPDLQEDLGPTTLYPPSEAESRVSAVSSYAGKDLEVDIPSRPKGEDGKELELFECPYCMLTKNITSHSKWKKHVLEDLQPYMCTYGSCQLGDHIFTSKNEWNQHEALYHRVKWFCNTSQHPEYEKQNDFIVHMKQDHQTVLNEARLATSGDIFRQPSRSNEGTCNLCLRHSTKVKGHVARHLEQISVFALPRLNRASGSVEAERRSQSSRRLRDEEQSLSDVEEVSARSSVSNPIDFNEPWIISETTKRLSDLYFTQSDIDKVGYITTGQALEIIREKIDPQLSKESCLQVLELAMLSGVDTLDRVEFAIALHLFLEQQKHPDQQIPTTLPQNLIPSNLRQQFSRSKESDLDEETFSDHAMVPDADVQDWDEITNKFVDARQGDAEAPPADFNSRETSEFKPGEDWAIHYGIRKEHIADRTKNEVERQNLIYEFAEGEYTHLQTLGVLLKLYRNGMRNADPPVILPRKLGAFDERVFGKVNAVEEVDAKLLHELRERQQKQGPWVIGISDLIREYVRYARKAYFEYAAAYPQAAYTMKREISRNMPFRVFLDHCRTDRASLRLSWDHFLKQPITRLQRRCLILDTILRNSKVEDEEKRNLVVAIDELKFVVDECDDYLSEAQRKIDLMDLHDRIKLRPGMANTDLKLDHIGRELVYRGELLRNSTNNFSMLETAVFLFDNYLVLTKPVRSKNDDGTLLNELYDVSRPPIPIDLLRLDDISIAPVVPSGIRGGTKTATPADDKASLLFPFTFRHVGYADYTLFASSEQSRAEWARKIIDILRKHASKLDAQNMEPYLIKVISDAHIEGPVAIRSDFGIRIAGTPLDKALVYHWSTIDADKAAQRETVPPVNCAISTHGLVIREGSVLIGTDKGIYMCNSSGNNAWRLLADVPKVTNMFFLNKARILLVFSDQSLLAYDVTAENSVLYIDTRKLRPTPQKVSGANKVLCFTTADFIGRELVICAIRESWGSTVFKVLQHSTPTANKKKPFLTLGRATAEEVYLRDYDEFYLPDEAHKIITFRSSIAVVTSKAFEVLTLEKKQPFKIPDFDSALGKNFAKQFRDQGRLNMFRLKEEFLLCYEEGAIFIDPHGDISRSGPMNFCSRAQSAAMEHGYLILFHEDFVEIRNAEDEKLKQIIMGRSIRCVDDNSKGDGTVKFVMQDPERPNTQLLLELVQSKNSQSDPVVSYRSNEDLDVERPTAPGVKVVDASKPQSLGGRIAHRFSKISFGADDAPQSDTGYSDNKPNKINRFPWSQPRSRQESENLSGPGLDRR